MNTKKGLLISFLIVIALLFAALPAGKVEAESTVPVYILEPSWTAPGGGGVFSAYIPSAGGYFSPGLTAVYDGREAGIIKAGLEGVGLWDQGLYGFIPNVTIDFLAARTLSYDMNTQAGVNSVWMTIEIDTGVVDDRDDNVTYQHVPANSAGWHTINAAAGLWQKWNNNEGDTSGNPYISLADISAAHTGKQVVRAYLRLGKGDSYYNGGTGTIAWVDKVTMAEVTYDFLVNHTWYVATTGSDTNSGTTVSNPFRSIQHAHDIALAGDTIIVADGTYTYLTEGITLPENQKGLINIYKQIIIKAADDSNSVRPVIDASSVDGVFKLHANTLSGGQIVIEGFDITGDKPNTGTAITLMYCGQTPPTEVIIRENAIHGMIGGINAWASASWCAAGTDYKIYGIEITDNEFYDLGVTGIARGFGIALDGVSDWTEAGNSYSATISGNSFNNVYTKSTALTDLGVGIALVNGAANASVFDNTFSGDISVDIALQGTNVATANVYHNDLSSGVYGVAAVSTTGGLVDASPNWWGTTVYSAIQPKVMGSVTYIPWCTDVTCTTVAGPVHNLTQDTWFTTIQAAIEAANAGDEIYIANGTYVESPNIYKSLSLIGESEAGVIIDARTFSDYGMEVMGDITTTLRNFTLLGNPTYASAYGLKVSGDAAFTTIDHVTVTGSWRSGIDLNGLNGGTVSNVTSRDSGYGVGLALTDCSNIAVSNVTTSGNAWGGMAIYTGNTGTYSHGSDGVSLSGTNSFGETNKLYIETKPGYPVTNFTQTMFPYTVKNGEFLWFVSNMTEAGGLALGLPAPFVVTNSSIEQLSDGSHWVVNGMTIQAAINASTAGDTINVGPGTYDPVVNITVPGWAGTYPVQGVVVWKDDLTIKATDPNPANTIIQTTNNGAWMDWWRIQYLTGGVFTSSTPTLVGGYNPGTSASPNAIMIVAEGVTIDGFTIHAHAYTCDVGYNGSGVLIGGVAPGQTFEVGTYNNNTIKNNILTDVWAGVYLWHSSDNTILNNTITQGACHAGSSIRIFDGNDNTQLALALSSSDNTIEGNNLTDNGIMIGPWGTTVYADVSGTVIKNNTVNGSIRFDYSNGSDIEVIGNTINSGQIKFSVPTTPTHVICTDCIIDGNTLNGNNFNGNGIEVYMTGGEITDNTVDGFKYYGINVSYSSDVLVSGNIVRNHTTYGGIIIPNSSINTSVTGNTVTNNKIGVYVYPNAGTGTTINGNSIVGNTVGVQNDTAVTVDATGNWWGSATGPATGQVIGDVAFCGWLDAAPPAGVAVAKPVINANTGEGFCTIQAAIDDLETLDGHTITVEAGIYTEPILIDKSVTLLGPNALIDPNTGTRAPEAILQGTTTSGLSEFVNFEAENVVIMGFTFDNLRIDNYYNSIHEQINGDIVKNNIFKNITGTPIHLRDGRDAPGLYSTGVNVSNNKVDPTINAGVDPYNAGSGIVVWGAENSTVADNVITSAAYNGIQLGRCSGMSVSGNVATGAAQPALQIAQWNDGTFTISGNTFSSLSTEKAAVRLYGFTNSYYPLFNFTGNTIEDSLFAFQIGHGDPGKGYNDIRDADYSFSGNTLSNISSYKLIVYLATEATVDEKAEMDALFAQLYGAGNTAAAITTADPFTYVVAACTTDCYVAKTGNDANPGTETSPFLTIQKGIDSVSPNGTVHVAAGTYVEDPVIDKALTLLGPNATINPNTGTRVAEAIILPAYSAPDPDEPCELMTYIEVSGVTIKGFTFDGDNPALTSGVMIGTADVDACEIIASYEGVGNIVIENNILKHATYSGIDLYNYTNPAATAGNYIQNNLIQNIGETTYNWGIGILLYNNFYADVTGNVMEGVRLGIQTGNYYLANPGTTGSISNNEINAWALGIFHNLWYSAASNMPVSGNTINAVSYPDYSTKWNGMLVTSFAGAANTSITNNIITIPDTLTYTQYSAGYNVWNDNTTLPLVISGGTVTGGTYGVFVNNYDGYPSDPNIVGSTSVTVDGVTILESDIAGVYVKDNSLNTHSTATVYANIINNNIDTDGTGILIEGSDATADVYHNDLVDNPTAGITNLNTGFSLVAAENWWGSILGPQSPINGDVDVIKWCSKTNLTDPGCYPLLPDDTNTITLDGTEVLGDANIYVPGLTIVVENGLTIANDGACFNINASSTTIQAESKLGAVCKPASGFNGIDVADDLNNVIILNLAFDGTRGGVDGIHFSGGISDIMIVDNWFHVFTGDAIEFTAQPTLPDEVLGTPFLIIQGNLFETNGGLGINASTFTVPAEFNSWGHVDGAIAGDGKSEGVDADPWTHVDLYVGASGVVSVGGDVIVTIYGNLENVMGANFTLDYDPAELDLDPASLADLSAFVPGLSGMFIIDETAGTITFDGTVETGESTPGLPISDEALPLFSATFEVLTSGASLNFVEATDEFYMLPTTEGYNPSTNIYALKLVGGVLTDTCYDVTGTITMQGRTTVRYGIPATLTGITLYGPYTATTNNNLSNNLAFVCVAPGTYTFTTNQPRYLNVAGGTYGVVKTIEVTDDMILPSLTLIAGNARWDNNRIDAGDSARVGACYGYTATCPVDPSFDGDVNFDGKINLLDLSIVGGNFYKTSASEYGSW